MADPFIGEIRLFGFDFNPLYWLMCDGSQLPIANYTPLFAVIGNAFGGDGKTNFQLPDLRGRAAIGFGQAPGLMRQAIGQTGGQPTVALTTDQIPSHNHVLNAGALNPPNPDQNVASPSSEALLGLSGPNNLYLDPVTPDKALHPASISPNGSGLPHDNMQPYVAINFCIAWSGVFPPRS
jgi:microcystin-dependent protein